MPALCSLLLEVYSLLSIYDDAIETIEWEASTDPDHLAPYLIAPQNYAAQEIDPIKCAAQIGTIEVGVIDVPQVFGDQSTGWMTARVHDLLGRRCRLRRYINAETGYVTIADGPAGPPHMDPSYAAYRWTIRDTRETERKLKCFLNGGNATIVPRGALYGFGEYEDTTPSELGLLRLLPRIIDVPVTGDYVLGPVGDRLLGLVNFAGHFSDRLIMDQTAIDAIGIAEISNGIWGCPNADVLWRVAGDTIWNRALPTSPSAIQQPFVGRTDGVSSGGSDVQMADFVTLFVDEVIPPGFPTSSGASIECIIRYTGPATTDFPYYVEGTLGDVLRNLYTGVYTLPATAEITGLLYDPNNQDGVQSVFRSRIRFDSGKLDTMLDHVLLRQTTPIADARAFAEAMLYAPSGWIPALDDTLAISPIQRSAPVFLDHTVDDDVAVPNPNWQTGETTVSQLIYTYPRYYLPAPTDTTTSREADGLATRDVILEFIDGESALRYGEQIQEYDCSAFAAVGDDRGVNLPGVLETASLMEQNARFDVLDRYRAGAQSIKVAVLRARLPTAIVGDWVPWSLMHLPDRLTGLRGSNAALAQILSIQDDDCEWRTMVLEESGLAAGAPGFYSDGMVITDDDSPGFFDEPHLLDDEESY